MRQTYSHILTFWFKHRYFKDELFKSVNISFADGSQKLINDLGIIIKPFSGGFNFLALNPELLDSGNDIHSLQIYLYIKDPLYINYTELPSFDLRDKLLYFNNLSINAEPENKQYLLHQSKFASDDDVIQICQGRIDIPEYNPAIKYRFTDASGIEISSESLTQAKNDPNSFIISGIDQGLVRVFTANEELLKAYYYPLALWKKPMGVIEFFTGELFKQFKTQGKVDYAICFDNRKTKWKYFFISPVYQKFKNLSIINKAKEQIFNPPKEQIVLENTQALVFESKNKIPLTEFSGENFQLVENYDPIKRTSNPVLKTLTKASPEQLFSAASKADENVYSHIYI
jgi:hypothetical protein